MQDYTSKLKKLIIWNMVKMYVYVNTWFHLPTKLNKVKKWDNV